MGFLMPNGYSREYRVFPEAKGFTGSEGQKSILFGKKAAKVERRPRVEQPEHRVSRKIDLFFRNKVFFPCSQPPWFGLQRRRPAPADCQLAFRHPGGDHRQCRSGWRDRHLDRAGQWLNHHGPVRQLRRGRFARRELYVRCHPGGLRSGGRHGQHPRRSNHSAKLRHYLQLRALRRQADSVD